MADTATDSRAALRVSPLRAAGLSPRDLAPAWFGLTVLAALAWVVTLLQARGMGAGVGTMGLGFPLFLGLWVAMMSAMMFPSVAPVAILWARAIKRAPDTAVRVYRLSTFVGGYMAAWTGYGVLAFVALVGTERLVATAPGVARWLGIGIVAAGGIYQFTPFKEACLRHCRSPFSLLLRYASVKGAGRDFRVGLHHGAYCVGCCWGLMVVLVAVGVMNVAAMAGLAAVIFLEKLSRRGDVLMRLVGAALVVLAVLAAFHPWLLPGVRAMEMR
jgi:predicted metal-binding membrane protein